MPQARSGNAKLAAVITEAGMSHAEVARAFVRVAKESNAPEFAGVGRSHVSHWIAGSKPSGRAPTLLCEALSRKLGRVVTLDEIGLPAPPLSSKDMLGWRVDTLAALTELGRVDVDAERRRVLSTAAYSLAALTLPSDRWWSQMAERGRVRGAAGGRTVSRGDVDAVHDMMSLFSRVDQRRGGGHARSAVVQYLSSDVASFLCGRYADDILRRDMFTAASELSYLAGWMAFDNGEHNVAQHYFNIAVKLAAEADNPAMAGHVLRAMAHQAIDLGHRKRALNLASASVDGERYKAAAPRERALLGVVYARALAVNGETQEAARALLRAEDDLAAATGGDDEPGRVFFFGEASLAHETACALRDTGDLTGATTQFRRSVRTRQASAFTRTHAVTLGYMGAVQARQGEIEEACATWSRALDAMEGVRSGRTREVAVEMRAILSPYRRRSVRAVRDVDARAKIYLSTFA
ncbi:tetratricopeptide repeat protein [Micromonospora andamanensis]|uniref:Tat pathway signal protein n=1 Tax=Micromonospora andamanensis TaxID=1287068 RepID=UPI00194F39D9|nr:Tat pathway signal protein [Micromonospora andamanensis]GIJ38900.1 Tat pathway signal protein [Micromonospora andamanensis]